MQAQETEPVTAADPPQLIDRPRWSGEVVQTGQHIYRWGTHEFHARAQRFADGDGNLQVGAPSDPPLAAREIVADGLRSSPADAAVAAILADAWGIDVDQMEADVE